MQKVTVAEYDINTKLPDIEEKDRKKEMLDELEIDALELLSGKMNLFAMEHLHKQICSIIH